MTPRKISPRSSRPPRLSPLASCPKRGFALLITITLLAFLVLLLVSLASLTRVETQVAGNNQSLSQARQNALMALNIALGQLQKYTGPDQRVTAAADIASAADGTRLAANAAAQNTASVNSTKTGLSSVQTGTRWWTGVWGRSGSAYSPAGQSPYAATPSPVLLNWLVSGNEDRTFTADATGLVSVSDADTTTSAKTAPFVPGAPVNWSAAGLDTASPATWTAGSAYSNLEIKTSGQKAVLLVGPRTAGTAANGAEAAVERYVVAPLKNIDTPSSVVPGAGSSGSTTVGRYAWWVGDEGVKASYSLADPHAGQTDPVSSDAARLRLMTASRSGIELVSNWQDYPAANDTAADAIFDRVLDLRQVPMLTSSVTSETQRAAFHDFTRRADGVLSDTLNGGLRKDLTYYFESASNWNASPLKGASIIPSTWSPDWGAAGYAPKWDWLYSFYNTNPSVASPALTVRPETPTEVGINPIITQFRMIAFTDSALLPGSKNVMNMPYPAGNYKLPVRCNVVFVLANPYNARLDIPANTYELVLKNTYANPSGVVAQPTAANQLPPGLVIGASDTNHSVSASYGSFVLMRAKNADASQKSLLDTVRFIVPSLSIAPGETAVLSVNGSSQIAGAGGPYPSAGAEDPVQLQLNDSGNPVLGKLRYFTANTTFDFTAPAPVAPATTTRVVAFMYVYNQVAITISLRRTSDRAVLQQVTDASFSKPGETLSYENEIIGNLHIKFMPPARRDLDSSSAAEKFHYALFTYGRPHQDFNLRATNIDHPAVSNGSVWTPPSYAGGISRNGIQSASGEFTENLSPATWAENFGPETRSPVASKGIFFDFPRRTTDQPPVTSIGQLQHASLSTDDRHAGMSVHYQPAYAVGNSYHNPFVTRGSSVQTRGNNYYLATGANSRYFDLSYLLNTALWDGYFFSGVPQSGPAFKPLNPRYRLDDSVTSATPARSADSAAKLSVKGSFNINSTSKNAWIALLGGLNGLRVNDDSASSGVPYPRTLWQTEDSQSTGGSFQTSGTDTAAYAGYRRLTSTEIDRLATEIVKRVRARGPFVSLSHFINRTLVAASASFNSSINDADTSGNLASATIPQGRGLAGPLQAAIDSSAAGINAFQLVNGDQVLANESGAYGDRVLFAGEILSTSAQKPTTTNTGVAYFADKLVDLPNLDPFYTTPPPALPGPQGRTSTAIPGWLLQGDLLQAIGPALSARSDTFVIRTYGEVLNPADSTQRLAMAWCEATVQRVPDYVDSSANPASDAPSALSTANTRFGRAYKVVSFRWLSPEDI